MMKTSSKKQKKQKPEKDFDYTKTWYLLPHYPSDEKFFGHLYEGKILHDKSAFRKRKDQSLTSRIKIADLTNICRKLSDPFIFPVTVDKKTRVVKADEYSWYTEKVQLLKPVNVWDIFPMLERIFPGTINLNGQPYLPLDLVFPEVIKGDLVLSHSTLPSRIKLPGVIEGGFEVTSCNIPPTWKLPRKMTRLFLHDSSFYSNVDLKKITVSAFWIEGCSHPSRLSIPRVFPGRFEIGQEDITPEFTFPEEVEALVISESSLNEGVHLSKRVTRELIIIDTKVSPGIIMPSSCKSFAAMDCEFPGDFTLPLSDLEEIEFVQCKLPANFRFPELATCRKLSFNDMKIPPRLKLPQEFTGTLEFEGVSFPQAIKLPKILTGSLVIKHSTIPRKLKLPLNDAYEIIMYERDDTSMLIGPESVMSAITFLEIPRFEPQPADDDLPF